MMKSTETVKELEITAANTIRDLLGHVPNLEISSVDYEEYIGHNQIDLRIALSRGGVNYALIIEVKANGAPRFVRSAIYHLRDYVAHVDRFNHADADQRLIPMLVSPYLSPESRALCTDHNVAYLDLCGNAHLAFDSVYIDRAVADKPKVRKPCATVDLQPEGSRHLARYAARARPRMARHRLGRKSQREPWSCEQCAQSSESNGNGSKKTG